MGLGRSLLIPDGCAALHLTVFGQLWAGEKPQQELPCRAPGAFLLLPH